MKVGFTAISERLSPIQVVMYLNRIFTAFDKLLERYKIEKIKTIGDAYMAVAGAPFARADHVEVMLVYLFLVFSECLGNVSICAGNAGCFGRVQFDAAAGRASVWSAHRHQLRKDWLVVLFVVSYLF